MGLVSQKMEDNAAMNHIEELTARITARLLGAIDKTSTSAAEVQHQCEYAPDDVALGHLHEQISAEASFLVQQNVGPTPLLTALLTLNLPALCPMAAEAFQCAADAQHVETTARLLINRSPVFEWKKVLFAAPVGPLDASAMLAFCDRILAHTQQSKIKMVHVLLCGLVPLTTEASEVTGETAFWRHFLSEELLAQKIALVIL